MIHLHWRRRLTERRGNELNAALRAIEGVWGSEVDAARSAAIVTPEEEADEAQVMRAAIRTIESLGCTVVEARRDTMMSGEAADDTGALWAVSHAEESALDLVDDEASFLRNYSPWGGQDGMQRRGQKDKKEAKLRERP